MSVRACLDTSSALRPRVKNGKQALKSGDRPRVVENALKVKDSLDLDEAMRSDLPHTHRWDYLLGTDHAARRLLAVEVHPANTGEARVVIQKKIAASAELAKHLRPNEFVQRWYWVASGTTKITRNTPEARMLDRAGVILVGSQLLLPGP